MKLLILILLSAVAFPFVVHYGIILCKYLRPRLKYINKTKVLLVFVFCLSCYLFLGIIPNQILQNNQSKVLSNSFCVVNLNQHLKKSASVVSNSVLNNSKIPQLTLAKDSALYTYNHFTHSLFKTESASAIHAQSAVLLHVISLKKLTDAYYEDGDSTYFEHQHELIFTQNNRQDLYDFKHNRGFWRPDLTEDIDDNDMQGTNGFINNLNYIDPVEDGFKTQCVALNSQYHAFPIKSLKYDSALRKVYFNKYDSQTFLRHEWHPAMYKEINLKHSGKLYPVIYYQVQNKAYYIPLTKFGENYYYKIVLSNNETRYVNASDVIAINDQSLFVYNLPIKISIHTKNSLLNKLLLKQSEMSAKDTLYKDDPYNYRLNYEYPKQTSNLPIYTVGSDLHIHKKGVNPIPIGRVIDENKYVKSIYTNQAFYSNLVQTHKAITKTRLKFDLKFKLKDKDTNHDEYLTDAQIKKTECNQILQKQKVIASQQTPKYATATLKGKQPDIQHLLALSFGYTNLDPYPNDPWKRNKAGQEPYLKFDTMSSPTAKHNIQPKYPINKVVYVQSIVRNSIKGRHNEFYLLTQGDERSGNTIKRWTYPIMPSKYVHVSSIVNHKQIKTHYNNFLDTSIFAYHMLDLDRYSHYDNAFRFIPDYTTPHNVYQTSGQPWSRTTDETIYDAFLPPIDTANDNLRQER